LSSASVRSPANCAGRSRGARGRRSRSRARRRFLVVDVHRQAPAVGEAAEQQLVGQGAADGVLDQALHRARAHQRIEALLGQVLAQLVGEGDVDLLLGELRLQLQQELVDHAHDDHFVQRLEAHHGVQTVAELGREQALDVAHLVALPHARLVKPMVALFMVSAPAFVVMMMMMLRKSALRPLLSVRRAVVHHLQQHVVQMSGCAFSISSSSSTAVRLLGHGLGQQAALVEAHISRAARRSGG
jgi:hypothetical protein